jgi:hypothetical protein
MGQFSGYASVAPATNDKVLILDVSDPAFPAGNEKLALVSDLLALGGVILDSTASDIQAAGVQAAGATGKAADAGHVHPATAPLSLYQSFSGALAETFPRIMATTSTPLTSGTLSVCSIGLPKGLAVNNITFGTKGTAMATVTHGWYVLLDSGLVVRAVTADQTTGTWMQTANQLYTLPTTATYTTTYTGVYYVGMMAVATTIGNNGTAGNVPGNWASNSPVLCGLSNTGQTTPPALGATMTAITSNGNMTLYAYVS